MNETGYWKDPPGYFDEIVWPQYVQFNQRAIAQASLSKKQTPFTRIHDFLALETDSLSIQDMTRQAVDFLIHYLEGLLEDSALLKAQN
jgi:nicotinamide/nicotinate riboside kinase